MNKPATVAEEALELARWLGTGQALLARLQELFSGLWMANDALGVGPKVLPAEDFLQVHKVISAAVEHFGEMP